MRFLVRPPYLFLRRCFSEVPWHSPTALSAANNLWRPIGEAAVTAVQAMDSGPQAYRDVLESREQLQHLVNCIPSLTEFDVCIFGGVTSSALLEAGGDADFVIVGDAEPTRQEAMRIVELLGRELRRVGLRAMAVPRARVPVVKVNRVASRTSYPGTPLTAQASAGRFQFSTPMTDSKRQDSFTRLLQSHGATQVEWDSAAATAFFASPTMAVRALARIRSPGLLLAQPVDPPHGPELFRFSFDLCMASSGLRNAHLLGRTLEECPFGRHLLLLLKRWARGAGIVNAPAGLLSSHALVVMLVHYMLRAGLVSPLDPRDVLEPQFLPRSVEYRSLAEDVDPVTLGYHLVHLLHYYARVFDYRTDVVATSTREPVSKADLGWTGRLLQMDKQPWYHLCIKDSIGSENVTQNMRQDAVESVRKAFISVVDDLQSKCLAADPSNLAQCLGLDSTSRHQSSRRRTELQEVGDATARWNQQAHIAQDLTQALVNWIQRSD